MNNEKQKSYVLQIINTIKIPSDETEAWREYDRVKNDLYQLLPSSEHKFITDQLLSHLRL